MPTAVLDMELTNLPPEVLLPGHYNKAFLLLRFKGRPLGQKTLPVTDGRIILQEYHKELLDAVNPSLWQQWVYDYLNWDEQDTIDFTLPKATIAICTRDRTDDLKRCLDALLKLPDDGQEIIVIDNCPSTDATQKLVENYPNVRYILETRPGLNIARNRALQEARHAIVAFTDDDAVPDTGWLRALLRNFDSSLVGCVTGITMPLELETEAQEAFERYGSFSKGFKRKVYGINTHNPLSAGGIGAGVNMAIRKSLVPEIGAFDEALDAGTPTQSGGDHEYFVRVMLAGYTIIYEPAALVWHRHRRTWAETHKTIKGYGMGVYAYWTRLIWVQGEWGVLKLPWKWFTKVQFRNLIRALLRRPGAQPLDLVLAELQGCFLGPWAYRTSRKRLKKQV